MTAASNTAFITGATGFIGSRLAHRLVNDGWNVHLLTRPTSGKKQIERILHQVTLHSHDGSTENLIDILAQTRPTLVFHLATMFLSAHKPGDIVPLFQSNVLFSAQLLEAMHRNQINRLINTGTFSQHYQSRDYSPALLYDTTKRAVDGIVQFYHEAAKLSVITLELFDSYGPDDPRPKLFALLKRISESGETLKMSPGEQLIDIVHVDDIVNGYLIAAHRLLASKEEVSERFALSSGRPIPLKELVAIWQRIIGRRVNIEWGGRPYRPREIMVPWNRGTPLPGWQAVIALEEGLRRMGAGPTAEGALPR